MNREILEKEFEPSRIKKRKGPFGETLDYVEAADVIRRLNASFDGEWSFEIVEYREMFDDVKVKLAELHPDWRPIKVDRAARNRVATKLAKDVYRLMKTGHTN